VKLHALFPALVLLAGATACEVLDQVKGVATLMGEAGEHLEQDLKEPLTDERIDLFLRVTPALQKFSETAKVKWKPDPAANDFSQMSTSLGALGDYAAFFESEDTRLTEYWTITLKVYDAVALISFEEGQVEARKRLEQEQAELAAKRAAASGAEAEALDKEIERNKIARENLDKIAQARKQPTEGAGQKPYTLSEQEIALVRARKVEIQTALESAGYDDKVAKKD
jgi:hypothetical protein